MIRVFTIALAMIAFGMAMAGCHGEVGGSVGKNAAYVTPGH